MQKFLAVLVGVVLVSLTAACGRDSGELSTHATVPAGGSEDAKPAGASTAQFGNELFDAIAKTRGDANTVISPASIAIALSMLEPGATGDGQAQLRSLLHIDNPDAFHASMRALIDSLITREPQDLNSGPDQDPGDLTIEIANALFMQESYPVLPQYRDTLADFYGSAFKTVDFATRSDDAVDDINGFIDDGTHGLIKDLVKKGSLGADTVLALVNALYLKASWLEPFKDDATADGPFMRADGTKVTTPLMHGNSDDSLAGDGFVAATKHYGGGLSAQFVLPDPGKFDQVRGRLGDVFTTLVRNGAGATLVVPRFETRLETELTPMLKALGLTAVYAPGSLTGLSNDDRLFLDQALHGTFLSMDEQGTEAAAATVLVMRAVSGSMTQPVPVVLDRPFFFRIFDNQTDATLFVGQIVDPT